MRVRTWIFVLVGATLLGFASFVFALTRDPDGWNGLTMTELAARSLVVGASVGAILGLLVARVTVPSRRRRLLLVTLFAVVGATIGIVLTLAAARVLLGRCDRVLLWPQLPRMEPLEGGRDHSLGGARRPSGGDPRICHRPLG
jgi:hypothetical protein